MRFIFEQKDGNRFYKDCKNLGEAIAWFKEAHAKNMELPEPNPPVRMLKEMLIEIATIDELKK